MRVSLRLIVFIKCAALVLLLAGLPWRWALGGVLGADLWVFYHLFMPGASGLVRTITRFQTPRPEVWLTIDDGPDEHDTPRILDLLDQHEARATFFLVGERALRQPALVAEIARRGHQIGHHTHTHPVKSFWHASPGRVGRELDTALPALTLPDRTRPQRFRAPAGLKSLFLAPALAARNLTCIGWTVRSFDSLSKNPARVVARVLSQTGPGAIILMHEGPPLHPAVRVTALAGVLAGLKARNLRCVIPADAQLS